MDRSFHNWHQRLSREGEYTLQTCNLRTRLARALAWPGRYCTISYRRCNPNNTSRPAYNHHLDLREGEDVFPARTVPALQCHRTHRHPELWRWNRYPIRRSNCKFVDKRHSGITGIVRRAIRRLPAAPPAAVENIPSSKLSGKFKNLLIAWEMWSDLLTTFRYRREIGSLHRLEGSSHGWYRSLPPRTSHSFKNVA